MKNLLISGFVILTAFIGFTIVSENSNSETQLNLTDSKMDFKGHLVYNESDGLRMTDEKSFEMYFRKKFKAQSKDITFQSFEIFAFEEKGKSVIQVVASFTNNTGELPLGTSFVANRFGELTYALSESHSCSENPCNCCGFIKRVVETGATGWGDTPIKALQIVGCKCNSYERCEPGGCNHTVSTN